MTGARSRRRMLAVAAVLTLVTTAWLLPTPPSDHPHPTLPLSTHAIPGLGQVGGRNAALLPLIPVGTFPAELAYAPVTAEMYVTDNGGSSSCCSAVSVINTTTNAVVATIPVGGNPNGILYDPATGHVYLTNSGGAGDFVGANSVSDIDPRTHSVVATIPVGHTPNGIVLDPITGNLYTGNWGSGNISVISTATDRVVANIPVPAGNGPEFGAWDAASGQVVFSEWSGPAYGNATFINPANESVVGQVRIGAEGWGAAYNPLNHQIVTTSGGNGPAVSFFNATTRALVLNYTVPCCVSQVIFDPNAGEIVLENQASGLLQFVSSTTDRIVWNATAPGYDVGVAVDTANGDLYYSDAHSNAVKVVAPLTSVGLSIPSLTPTPGSKETLRAQPTCPGSGCHPGVSYTWSLNNSLGSLNSTTGSVVNFTTGSTAGVVSVSLAATLFGVTVHTQATIQITPLAVPVLTAVSIESTGASVTAGTSRSFQAITTCTGGACPPSSSMEFAWTLVGSLGSITPSTGNSTLFTAGPRAGTCTLRVIATLGSHSVNETVSVMIVGATPTSNGFLGLQGQEGYILLGLPLAVVVIVILGLVARRPRAPPPATASSRTSDGGPSPPTTSP